MEDLWPSDLQLQSLTSPLAILKEQGAFLGSKTKNIVTAQIVPIEDRTLSADPITREFKYEFQLCGPAIGNYRYGLFQIKHSIDLYPITLTSDREIIEEIKAHVSEIKVPFGNVQIDEENQFREVLKVVFAAPKTSRIISAIRAQSNAASRV